MTNHHDAGQPAVANMSLGASASPALDQAVDNSIADGVTYSVAAGNDDADACDQSPAEVASALTVGSTTTTDARSSFSNYRHLRRPLRARLEHHVGLEELRLGDEDDERHLDGKHRTSPGTAALYLQGAPAAAPATVAAALVGGATSGKVTSAGNGSPNKLLFSLTGTTAPPPVTPPPVTPPPVTPPPVTPPPTGACDQVVLDDAPAWCDGTAHLFDGTTTLALPGSAAERSATSRSRRA